MGRKKNLIPNAAPRETVDGKSLGVSMRGRTRLPKGRKELRGQAPPTVRQAPPPRDPETQKIAIDWTQVDYLGSIHCTLLEIAACVPCSLDLLERRCVEEKGRKLEEYVGEKMKLGKASLRRTQYKLAEAGDKTMNVWLGKNWLGQTDHVVNVNLTPGTALSDQLLDRFRSMLEPDKEPEK